MKVLKEHQKRFKGAVEREGPRLVSYSVTAYGYEVKRGEKHMIAHERAEGALGVRSGEESGIYGAIISRHSELSKGELTEYNFRIEGMSTEGRLVL